MELMIPFLFSCHANQLLILYSFYPLLPHTGSHKGV
jgi:hypothetical protein